MSIHIVGGEDFVLTREGPLRVGALSVPGSELLVLDPTGQMTYACVARLEQLRVRTCVRILSEIGEVVLFDGMCVMGRNGPMVAASLRRELRSEATVHLEAVPPTSLPRWDANEASSQAIARSVLRHFSDGLVVLPAGLAVDHDLVQQVERIFAAAEVDCSVHTSSRWCSICFEPISDDLNRLGAYSSRLAMLKVLTAWEKHEGQIVSRIIDANLPLRTEFLLNAAGSRVQPRVAWTPGYYPVDCRIRTEDVASVTFVKTVALRAESREAWVVDVPGSRQVIVGMHMLMPRRRGHDG